MAWGGIKRTKYDIVFSKYVRARARYCCQRCGRQYADNSAGLHCSHYHGRRIWATRLHPINCLALCYGCHSYVSTHRDEYDRLMKNNFTKDELDDLKKSKNNVSFKKSDVANDEYYHILKKMYQE